MGRSGEVSPEKRTIPPRDPGLSHRLVDLSEYYNASRYPVGTWHSTEASTRLENLAAPVPPS